MIRGNGKGGPLQKLAPRLGLANARGSLKGSAGLWRLCVYLLGSAFTHRGEISPLAIEECQRAAAHSTYLGDIWWKANRPSATRSRLRWSTIFFGPLAGTPYLR